MNPREIVEREGCGPCCYCGRIVTAYERKSEQLSVCTTTGWVHLFCQRMWERERRTPRTPTQPR
jgi:hypothetical protein